MKKILSILMIAVLCFTLIPSTANAAVKISKKSVAMYVNDSVQLKIIGTSKKVSWTSNNSNVANVSSTGKVSANAVGAATITAKIGTKKYTCSIKVKEDKEVTVTVTNMLNFDGFSDYLSTLDITKTVINEDYTTTYTMKESTQKKILSYLADQFDENDLSEMPAYYKKIDINDDMTLFKLTVDQDEYEKNKESDLTLFGLYIISGGYQQFAGINDNDIKFKAELIDNNSKKVFDTINISDFK